MSMACNCNRGAPYDGAYDVTEQCRLCYLRANDPAYRALFKKLMPRPAPWLKPARFVRALARHFADWMRTVPRTEREHRLFICRDCPHYQAAPVEKCTQCGCHLNGLILAKVKMASEKCPIGKW